ncbi:protein BatD [Proteobacteria bacterium 005FR1]|nr:protein BatD [Proteobacteria bacterium 005FR1]
MTKLFLSNRKLSAAVTVVFLFASLLFAAPASAAELTSSLDRTAISENETLQLTVRLNEQVGFNSPDFTALEEDFDILGQQRSSQFRSINGRTEAWTDWTLTLSPKSIGTLSIPAFHFEGAVSDPVEVTVTEASASADGAPQEIFVEVETNKSDVFVQEELLVTIKVHTGVLLRDASMNEELKVENAVVENVSETAYSKQIDGRLYRVLEMVYAIYPQQSGSLTIPSLSWNLIMATDRGSGLRYRFQAPGELRRVRSEPKVIQVRQQPVQYTGDHWLPTRELKLEQHWSSDPSRFVVGEPITRTITMTADGLTSAQLPPLPDQTVPGIKVYQDKPQFDDLKTSKGILGTRIESVAIVPTEAGELTLPEMSVAWWDTEAERERIATIPAQVLEIAPAANSSSNLPLVPPSNAPAGDEDLNDASDTEVAVVQLWPWMLSNAIFALLACIFLIAWLRKRPAQQTTEPRGRTDQSREVQEAFDAVRRACSDNNPRAVRNALGDWGRLYWQLPHAASLQDIDHRCGSEAVTKELAKLDEILYGTQQLGRNVDGWRGDTLWRALVKFKRNDKKKRLQEKANSDQLAPLYPTTQ